ncbi:hypothetical protein H6F43_02700 [Leptolyngbya sp. FACHB-36]|uniref:hypothetical protein n=1 Tax=Leptolyngbya sp. FACHB-36 TaxID=2692808 RepID=UPI00168021A3|nr:hypothetical protein [Leptolyngbya sp. FACHB-36]MBD2019094.1 hypothetical protein [Leptolyngbya sp. FACHB-36]
MVTKKHQSSQRTEQSAPPAIASPPIYQPLRSEFQRRQDEDFDEDRKLPLTQKLGNFSDGVFGFIFNPNVIKFGLLLFAGFCIAINLTGYIDLVNQLLTTRLDEFGRVLPVDAPMGQRVVSFFLRLPVIGGFVQWLDQLTGGAVALFGAICIWFLIQALEIVGRIHLYFPETAENLLYKQNRKRYERPGPHPTARKAYRMATTAVTTTIRTLVILGLVAYGVDAFSMHQVRPWIDTIGNPLWTNCVWNFFAVAGVELAMLIHTGYKAITLSGAEQADKDRLYG